MTSSPIENIFTASPTINSIDDIMHMWPHPLNCVPFVTTPDISFPTGNWSTFGTTCDSVCYGNGISESRGVLITVSSANLGVDAMEATCSDLDCDVIGLQRRLHNLEQ